MDLREAKQRFADNFASVTPDKLREVQAIIVSLPQMSRVLAGRYDQFAELERQGADREWVISGRASLNAAVQAMFEINHEVRQAYAAAWMNGEKIPERIRVMRDDGSYEDRDQGLGAVPVVAAVFVVVALIAAVAYVVAQYAKWKVITAADARVKALIIEADQQLNLARLTVGLPPVYRELPSLPGSSGSSSGVGTQVKDAASGVALLAAVGVGLFFLWPVMARRLA